MKPTTSEKEKVRYNPTTQKSEEDPPAKIALRGNEAEHPDNHDERVWDIDHGIKPK